MKLWLITAVTLVLFSGCNSRTQTIQLEKKNAQQALLIQKQQAKIDALNARLAAKAKARARALAKARARAKQRSTLPPPPKKNIKLKKVEDNNYTSGYMYPGAAKKKPVKVAQATTINANTSMDKAQCIAMIGPEKFAKYTQMFGSEAASLKRCKMLKAMKQ
jgi:ATPase subunit of ABC transporter with duplicated ATPase domains